MKITILHGSNDLYGASRVLLNEVDCLHLLGHQVTVVVPSDGPLTESLGECGAKVIVSPQLLVLRRSRLRDMLRPLVLPKAALEADVVILWTLALAAYAPKLSISKKPFYISVHELLLGPLGYWLVRTLLSFGRFPITACSHATKSWLTSAGVDRSRISVTYPFFSPPAASTSLPHSIAPTELVDDLFTIAVIGRVNGHKGHKEVALAFLRASKGDSNWRLLIVGSPYPGQEKALLEVQRVCGTDPRITFTGHVHSISDITSRIDLVACFPTKPEPFGLVPIEAWRLGITSAGFDDGGATEVLRLTDGIAIPRSKSPLDDMVMAFSIIARTARGADRRSSRSTEVMFGQSNRAEVIHAVLESLPIA